MVTSMLLTRDTFPPFLVPSVFLFFFLPYFLLHVFFLVHLADQTINEVLTISCISSLNEVSCDGSETSLG